MLYRLSHFDDHFWAFITDGRNSGFRPRNRRTRTRAQDKCRSRHLGRYTGRNFRARTDIGRYPLPEMEVHMKHFIAVAASAAMTLSGAALVSGALALAGTSPASALTCPTASNGSTMSCGSYTISGLGARKQQVLGAGASVLDLSVAMLETNTMQASSYPYGDGKTGDAANFGIFKQNWLMLRTACSYFKGQSSSQYNDGAALNSNLSEDVSCINQDQTYYGITLWFAGQRDGASGLSNPNTADIHNYETAVYWIESQLNSSSSNLSNDTRFWVEVPAI
jgi:hypothetical protein